jgi:hypothetical protein
MGGGPEEDFRPIACSRRLTLQPIGRWNICPARAGVPITEKQKMLRFQWLLVGLFALTLTGCGDSGSNRLVGKWKFDAAKAIAGAAESKNVNAPAALGLAQAMGMKIEMVMDFKSDHSLNVTTTGIPAPFQGDITWKPVKTEGDKLIIAFVNAKENKSNEVQITFIDNDHLRFSPPNANMQSMEFERVK